MSCLKVSTCFPAGTRGAGAPLVKSKKRYRKSPRQTRPILQGGKPFSNLPLTRLIAMRYFFAAPTYDKYNCRSHVKTSSLQNIYFNAIENFYKRPQMFQRSVLTRL